MSTNNLFQSKKLAALLFATAWLKFSSVQAAESYTISTSSTGSTSFTPTVGSTFTITSTGDYAAATSSVGRVRFLGGDSGVININAASGNGINGLNGMAINIVSATNTDINLNSGRITANYNGPTIEFTGGGAGTNNISVAAGAVISNSLNLNAIHFNTGATTSNITNNGTISSGGGRAISIDSSSGSYNITNNSSGIISSGNSSVNAIFVSGSAALYLFNQGSIVGSVKLGSPSSSTITLDGSAASISGEVTFGSALQRLILQNGVVANTTTSSGSTVANITIDSTSQARLNTQSLRAHVYGSSSGVGSLVVNSGQTVTTFGEIGLTANSLASVALQSNATLDLATTGNNLIATTTTLDSGSILNIGSGALTTTINGTSSGVGTANFMQNKTLTSSIGSTNKLSNFSVAANITLQNSSFDLNATSLSLNSGSILTVGSGAINTAVISSANNVGTVNFTQDKTLNGSIGTNISRLTAVSLTSGKVLTTSGNNIYATTLTLNSTSALAISGGSTVSGALASTGAVTIDSTSALQLNSATLGNSINGSTTGGVGSLTINASQAVITNTNIGSTNKLSSVTLNASSSLTLSTNNNSLSATSTILNSGSTLSVGTGALNTTITGASDGVGTVNLLQSISLAGSIGSSGSKLSSIAVTAAKTLTGNGQNIFASTLTLGASSILAINSGSSVNLSSVSGASGIITLDGTSSLSLGSGTISSSINGTTNGAGSLYVTGGTLTTATNIGSSKNLALTNIAANTTLNLNTGNNSLSATSVVLNSGSVINVGTGAINSVITAAANNSGTLNYNQNANLQGDLGTNSFKLSTVSIAASKILSTNGKNIYATTLNLNGSATLTISSGAIVSGAISQAGTITVDSTSALKLDNTTLLASINGSSIGVGALTINASQTVTTSSSNIGSSNKLASLTLANGATLDLATGNNSLSATSSTLNSGAVLNVGSGALNTVIVAASDNVGTLNFAQNNSLNGNIGTNSVKLAALTIGANATISAGTYNINSTSTTLNSGSVLNIGSAALNTVVAAASDNVGTLNFTQNNSLAGNVGSNSAKLAAVSISANATISAGSYEINSTNLTLNSGSVLNVGNAALNTAFTASANNVGTINFAQSNSLLGNIGSNSAKLSTVTIATNSTISAGSFEINSTSLTLASNSVLNVGGGALNTVITATSNNVGTLNFTQNNSLSGNIGASNTKLAAVSISANATISAGTYDLNSTSLTLNSGSVLNVGSGALNTAVTATSDNAGTLNFTQNNSLAGNVGSNSAKLAALSIATNATISAGSFDINSTNLTLDSGSVLNVGSGALNTAVNASTNNAGTLNFTQNNILAANIGSTVAELSLVTIASGKSLESNGKNIYAANISLLDPSSSFDISGGSMISATIIGGGIVTIDSTSLLALNSGTIGGSIDGGALLINSSQTVTAGDAIGSGTTLSSLTLGGNSTLNLDNNSLSSDSTILNSGSTLNVGSGALNSVIAASADNVGTLSFSQNNSLAGNIGTSDAKLSAITIAANATISAGSFDINSSNLTLNSAAVLNVGTGALNTAVVASANNVGTLNFAQNKSLAGNIGSSDEKLSAVNIAENTELSAGIYDINSASLTLGNNSTLTTSGALNSAVIASADNVGTLNFNGNVTLGGNLGSNSAKLSAINIASSHSLSSNGNNIYANNLALLASDSSLSINNGSQVFSAISGAGEVMIDSTSSLFLNSQNLNSIISGNGALTINNAQTVSANSDITLSLLSVNANSTLNLENNSLNATTTTFDSNSTLNVGDNVNINSAISLANSANINFSGASTISGSINGGGQVSVNSGTVDFHSTIGNSGALSSFDLASGATANFYENISASEFNFDGNVHFAKSGGNQISGNINTVSGANIDLGTESHNLNGDISLVSGSILSSTLNSSISGNLTASGIATINSGTSIQITIDQSLANLGTSYDLIIGGSGSQIDSISDNQININNTGVNRFGAFKFSTKVLGNELLLSIARINSTGGAANSNQENFYNNLISIDMPSGNIVTLQNFLTSDASDTQKSQAIDSAMPQVDNSQNRVSFSNSSASINLISQRMQALRGVASGEELGTKSVWGQVFGTVAKQGDYSGFGGYNSYSSGIAFGADKGLEDDLIIGMSISSANSSISASDNAKKTNVTTNQINFYASKDFEDYYFNSMLGTAFNRYDSNRYIDLVKANANAHYSGISYIGRAEVGANHHFKNDVTVSPFFAITAAKNKVNSYSEGGAGTLNLAVSNKDASFFETRLGTEISKIIFLKNRIKLRPSFLLSYGYDFAGSRQKSNSTFIGSSASFQSSGANISQGSLKIGGGLRIYQLNATTLDIDCSYESRFNYNAYNGSLKLKYDF